MSNFKGEYKKLINRYDKWEAQKVARIEKDLKAVVKRRCIALKMDVTNTQHSLSADNIDYDDLLKRKRFQEFQDFIYYISDNHKVDFYFTVENGKFRWLM